MSEPQESTDYERKRRDLEQLKACKADLASAIARNIDWLLETEAAGMLRSAEDREREPFGIVEASARARDPLGYDPTLDHEGTYTPERIDWHHLASLIEHEPERGRTIWLDIKAAARHELATGLRAADALEPPVTRRTPYQRAQYLAIIDALYDDLQPRGALEVLMIQRMAAAYEQCLTWQQRAIQRAEEDTWQGEEDKRRTLRNMSSRERERFQQMEGWLPPRLSQAEAVHEAALMADRFERALLRLIREFRNQRRMFASLIVAGGQVNITDGPQQVNNVGAETVETARRK